MFRDLAPKTTPSGVRRARKLRRAMSLPEVLVWNELRKRPAGLKFRRQHPCGRFVLDFFYCSDARLAIEIDGMTHELGDRQAKDRERDAWLADHGIATLRVPASEVLRELGSAIVGIVAAATDRLPLHHPAKPGGPPPRAELGED